MIPCRFCHAPTPAPYEGATHAHCADCINEVIKRTHIPDTIHQEA